MGCSLFEHSGCLSLPGIALSPFVLISSFAYSEHVRYLPLAAGNAKQHLKPKWCHLFVRGFGEVFQILTAFHLGSALFTLERIAEGTKVCSGSDWRNSFMEGWRSCSWAGLISGGVFLCHPRISKGGVWDKQARCSVFNAAKHVHAELQGLAFFNKRCCIKFCFGTKLDWIHAFGWILLFWGLSVASEMPEVNITLVLFTRGGVHSGLGFQEHDGVPDREIFAPCASQLSVSVESCWGWIISTVCLLIKFWGLFPLCGTRSGMCSVELLWLSRESPSMEV